MGHTIEALKSVITAERIHRDYRHHPEDRFVLTAGAVPGPFLIISRATSLRRCSQTVTPLRLRTMKIGASWTTSPLSLPLLTTSPMALVLPTSTGTSSEPRKSQLFLPMLPPKLPVSTSEFLFCVALLV